MERFFVASFAKIQILGRIGKRISFRDGTENNPSSVIFTVGVINAYGQVQWHRVLAKGDQLVNIARQYFTPDNLALITGHEILDEWQDSQGVMHKGVEILASDMCSFIPHKGGNYEIV